MAFETPHVSAGGGGEAAAGELLVAVGNGQLISHRIAGAEVTIGRDPTCDLVIDHNSLSRRHAVLSVSASGRAVTVRDLGSTNGTRVGGEIRKGGGAVAIDDTGFRIGPYAFMLVARRAGASLSKTGSELLRVDDPTTAGASRLVRDFAASTVNVLITGETGVGKEVLAATVHALSGRTGDFVQVNCAALSETLLDSELFGHERGAFTGAVAARRGLVEAADGGTLMLDEIGEIPQATQAKLLRVVEQREVIRLGSTQPTTVDVRFVAATNRDLPAEVARGAFRADLFYRLDGVTLSIPPLRERVGAIVPLALQFLEARGVAKPVRLASEVVAALEAHPWPGNVRELKAVIERAAVMAGSKELGVRHLAFGKAAGPVAAVAPASAPDAEREQIVRALADCAGNQTRAAALLGVSRTTLVTKIRIHGIARPSAKR